MAKLKKALKKIGKAAAVAGAAYAASKMMSPRDSEVGAKLAKKVSPLGSTYDMAGAGGPAKKSFLERMGIGKSPSSATYEPAPGQVDSILDMGVGGAKKGTFVTVKTKMGRNKKTKIC